MAKCDEGYRCEVCGVDVEAIVDSDLYLRYILGDVTLEWLHRLPERHVRCNPALAQYIVDARFESVSCGGDFNKVLMTADYIAAETIRVTSAWRRLQAVPTLGLSLAEYPLSITPPTAAEQPS